MQRITPFLWFDTQAEEAANFYVSIFKNSKVNEVTRYPEGSSMPAGTAMTVDFTLDGTTFTALNAGPHFTFNQAVSFVVHCADQAEVDYYWEKLTADGGKEVECGWLNDKYGLPWQVTPTELVRLISDPDPARAQRAMNAMMQMVKIDIEKVREAADNPNQKTVIIVEAVVNAPREKVWDAWTLPEHITHWNHASDEWHSPRAENDLRTGGQFSFRMEARDGSMGFDFGGTYDEVTPHESLAYTIYDGRQVQVRFSDVDGGTHVVETFEAEGTHSVDMQRGGWQAILNNFKAYVEGM